MAALGPLALDFDVLGWLPMVLPSLVHSMRGADGEGRGERLATAPRHRWQIPAGKVACGGFSDNNWS